MRAVLIKDGVVDNIIDADDVLRAIASHPGCIVLGDTGQAIGDLWDGERFSRPVPAPVAPLPLTRLEFLRRFTAAQRIAIRTAAQTNPIIADALQLLDLAQEVRLDDPDTLALAGYLVAVGLIADADRAALLA